MSYAWVHAKEAVTNPQKQQKQQYDKSSTDSEFSVGDRVFVFMPARKTRSMWKLAHPFEGPHRVEAVYLNGVDVRHVERPKA